MFGGGGDNNSNPSYLGELLKLPKKKESLVTKELLKEQRDTDWIEKEADYVDQVILKVGKPREPFPGRLSPDFVISLTESGTIDKFAALKNPEDVVNLVAKHFNGVHIPPQVLTKYQKNAGSSELLRNRGNELFKLKSFQDALHYYSLALMFAEPNTEAAGIAFANRSAVLVELGHFQDALQDIGLAITNKYPERLAHKLEQRRTKCEEFIKKQEEEYLTLDPQVRAEIETAKQKLRKLRDDLLRIEKPNPVIPSVPDFVEMKIDKDFGRHLIVTKDVPPATVMMVDDHYAVTLFGHSKWNTWYCHQCFRRIRTGIPCENCVFAIYCDEACRMEGSESFHRYECKSLPSFHAVATQDAVQHAVRIILKVGPAELFRLFEARDPTFFSPEAAFGVDTREPYDSQSYLNVYHLPTYPDERDYVQRIRNVNQALTSASILEVQTNFFECAPPHKKSEFMNFVAALLLRHIEADAIGLGLVELQGLENVSFTDSYKGKLSTEELASRMNSHKFKKYAGGVLPLFKLLKHSCDPNVHALNDLSNGTIIVFSHRALKKGERLMVAYNTRFSMHGLATRRELLDQEHVKCRCIACEEDWPILSELQVQKFVFSCPVCSKTFFQYEKKGSSPFTKCLLARPPWKCGSCGKRYKLAQLQARDDEIWELVLKLRGLLLQNRPQEALNPIFTVLDYLQFNIRPPFSHLCEVQDLLSKSFALILLFAQRCDS